MADKRISELTAAAALDGTEEVPANQGGSTVKLTIDDIQTFIAGAISFAGSGTFNIDCGDATGNTGFTLDCGSAAG
jgi:hypothetical protein